MATKSQISTLENSAPDAPAAAEISNVQRARAIDGGSGKFELLTIYAGTETDGQDAVNIGLNGYLYQIPRNKPYLVPEEVVDVLRNSVTTSYANVGGTQVASDRPRYAFSAVPE
jgi:archaellum component FlaF (FlaF/FlaG flagellin family)